MPLGNENKLKQEDEDIKYNSLNDSKFIDTDPLSYVSDLIIQISKNITHGRGLSKRGVNALSLFFLTGGLLYAHTVLPQTLVDFLKLYFFTLLFLLYFIIDVLKNITWINEGFMRIFGGRGFAYDAIIKDSFNLYELESCLEYTAFNADQLIDIVEHLIKKNQFSPRAQAKLMRNRALNEVKSINYIKNLLLEFEFTTKAVCIFLQRMETRLDYKYLDKLIEKYGESPSVQFTLGKYHKYVIKNTNPFYEIGCEFDYKRTPYDIIKPLVNIVGMSLAFCILFMGGIQLLLVLDLSKDRPSTIFDLVFCGACAIFILCLYGYSYLDDLNEKYFERYLHKSFLDKGNFDKNIIEGIVNDLKGVYFKN